MNLLVRPTPDHRPRPWPVPRIADRAAAQPMLDLSPPLQLTMPRSHAAGESDPVWTLARGMSHAIVEVLAGRRPATQLDRWATAEVIADLHFVARRGRRQLRVASVRCQRPQSEVIEVGVRVEHHGQMRSSAIALQIVRRGQRWQCCAIELGPEFSSASRGTS